MAIGAKPFSIQAPEDIAKDYGGNKQKIIEAARMGLIDPTAALMAGMFIDRIRSAQVAEQQSPPTVADEVFAPPQMPQQAGLGATPPATMQGADQMGAGPQMPQQVGGLEAAPVPEAMFSAGGGIVGYAAGDPVEKDERVTGGEYLAEAVPRWWESVTTQLGRTRELSPEEAERQRRYEESIGTRAPTPARTPTPTPAGTDAASRWLTPTTLASAAPAQAPAAQAPAAQAPAAQAPAASSGGTGPLGPLFESQAVEAIPGIAITSRQRSAAKNAEVGGMPTSYHLTDNARDFTPGDSGLSMSELHARLRRQFPNADVINEGDHIHVEPSPGQVRGTRSSAGGLGDLMPGPGMSLDEYLRATTPRDVGSPTEYVAQMRELFSDILPETTAITESIRALQDRNAPEELKAQRSQDLWGALANFGFRWAATGNLAESAQEGFESLQETLSGRKEQQLQDLLRIAELQGVQREQAMPAITTGLDAYFKERGFSQQEASRAATFVLSMEQMDAVTRRAALEAMLEPPDTSGGITDSQRITAYNNALNDVTDAFAVLDGNIENLNATAVPDNELRELIRNNPGALTDTRLQTQLARTLASNRLDAAVGRGTGSSGSNTVSWAQAVAQRGQ